MYLCVLYGIIVLTGNALTTLPDFSFASGLIKLAATNNQLTNWPAIERNTAVRFPPSFFFFSMS
jgi:hypothetical protein